MDQNKKSYRLGTLALHAGQEADPATMARAVPIYATSSYVFKSTEHAADLFALKEFGNIYSRLMNPTNDVLEKRLAALDGGIGGLAFASGQAAITAAILSIAHSGQNFISSTSLYGGTWTLFSQTFKKLGIEVRFFDPDHPEQIAGLVDDNTRSGLSRIDRQSEKRRPRFQADLRDLPSAWAAADCRQYRSDTGALPSYRARRRYQLSIRPPNSSVGTACTSAARLLTAGKFPWADNPAKWPEFTAPDEAYHGMIFTEALKPLGNVAYIMHIRTHWLRDTGACMSPFAAFLFLLGLETLHVRVERHVRNALALAQWLEKHPAVSWVNYPGLPSHRHYALAQRYFKSGAGAILGFGIRGGRNAGIRFINSVQLASHLANIGDAKTLVIHPASTTHSQLSEKEQQEAGVTQEYIRVSVGIEDFEDIQEDFDQALIASQQ